jgi:hypothetical protein
MKILCRINLEDDDKLTMIWITAENIEKGNVKISKQGS